MLRNQRFAISRGTGERRQSIGITDVAECDADITQETASFRSKNGSAGKTMFERGLVQREQIEQDRLIQLVSCVWLHHFSLAREAIPWTDLQAVVASVNTISNCAAKLDRN